MAMSIPEFHLLNMKLFSRKSNKPPKKKLEVAPTPAIFKINQEVIHVKTGGHYLIVGLPSQYVIEATREPAYAYLMIDGRICIRCQKEMEDGRFIPAEWQSQNTVMKFEERRKESQPVNHDRRTP